MPLDATASRGDFFTDMFALMSSPILGMDVSTDSLHVPCGNFLVSRVVALPPGFTLQSVNYVMKGLCAECSAQKK